MTFHQLLKEQGTFITLEKGAYLFKQGELNRSLYFVQSGLLKGFYISENGAESVKSFILANDVIGNLTALVDNQVCTFNVIALQEVSLIALPYDTLITQTKLDHGLASGVIELLMKLAIKKERREYEFLCLSPEQRYLKLIEQSELLMTQVTQIDIAGYLGITPVSLSRIKKRIEQGQQ
ncbi:Crp/Fnr family transcriptional regulator [Psychrobium sp. 1_MG-2023]|uniref:Crp/Fnr family transcriptional regulator n=1 Tax=Psychrobium sp. 1_MG-2023 TaxID=3062624 RepID=UPI000C33098B|nr:Crp/Fnr family transcriptional regulator [Psychrobium sp. 1_MG-2023]MDP2560070.1 Crp/Fnr family transcriptional regulator [Psychrobium sp. 1_MG-2023]PKF56269.1 hypothetical protein CW748_09905 [Alteromonadales bacterium alter-6D02]